jgi:hypothetical protein
MFSNVDGEVFFWRGKIVNNFSIIRKGDLIFGYQSSPVREIVALACVAKELHESLKFQGEGIVLKGIGGGLLEHPVKWDEIRDTIPDSEPLRCNAQGTLFKLTDEEARKLAILVKQAGNRIKIPNKLNIIERFFSGALYSGRLEEETDIAALKNKKNEIPPPKSYSLSEKDLEHFVIERLDQIEAGLSYIGNQISNEAGRIDILCKDKNGRHVVIELKRGETDDQVVGQVLRYIGWVREKYNEENVRGIIIVGKKNKYLEYAVSSLPNVELKEFSLSIS